MRKNGGIPSHKDVLGRRRVSDVVVIHSDGSTETVPAYRHDQAQKIVGVTRINYGSLGKPRRPRRVQPAQQEAPREIDPEMRRALEAFNERQRHK